jgi:hypothetical protein
LRSPSANELDQPDMQNFRQVKPTSTYLIDVTPKLMRIKVTRDKLSHSEFRCGKQKANFVPVIAPIETKPHATDDENTEK